MIQGSADSFYCRTWKLCHHGREFNLWWYSPLQNTTTHLQLNLHVVLDKQKSYRSFLAAPDMISNVNSLAIVTSSICEPLSIVSSHWSMILTLYQWMLSSSQWRCQPGRISMAAHRHDRRGIYRCVLLRFRGRIEIDHSYGLRWGGLCCHTRHSTHGAGRRARKRPCVGRHHSCCAGSAGTNHSSADRIVVNSYIPSQVLVADWFPTSCQMLPTSVQTVVDLSAIITIFSRNNRHLIASRSLFASRNHFQITSSYDIMAVDHSHSNCRY